MKGTSGALVSHMGGAVTTLARLAKLTRLDGTVFAVTDHDVDIEYPPSSGTVYLCARSIDVSSVEVSAELNVDNLEVRGFLSMLGVSEADIAAGRWDYCQVQIMRVNWADLTMGDEKIKRGWIGQISIGRDAFVNEIRGLTVKLQQTIGELYSPACKANVYDDRCKVVPTVGLWQFPGITVDAIVSAQREWTSAALTQPDDFFTAGMVTWTAGLNTGLSKEVKVHASGDILLQEPMPYEIVIGDEYTIFAGCQKRYQEDCIDKFDNGINNRGFPYLPGQDATLRGY